MVSGCQNVLRWPGSLAWIAGLRGATSRMAHLEKRNQIFSIFSNFNHPCSFIITLWCFLTLVNYYFLNFPMCLFVFDCPRSLENQHKDIKTLSIKNANVVSLKTFCWLVTQSFLVRVRDQPNQEVEASDNIKARVTVHLPCEDEIQDN